MPGRSRHRARSAAPLPPVPADGRSGGGPRPSTTGARRPTCRSHRPRRRRPSCAASPRRRRRRSTSRRPGVESPGSPPVCGPEAAEAVAAVLASGWLTTGPQVQEFEREMGEYSRSRGRDRRLSLAPPLSSWRFVRSGCRRARRYWLRRTFCGAVNAILRAGLVPVLVDVNPFTLMPDAETTAKAVARAGGVDAMTIVALRWLPGTGARDGRGRRPPASGSRVMGTRRTRSARSSATSRSARCRGRPASVSTRPRTSRSAKGAWSPPPIPTSLGRGSAWPAARHDEGCVGPVSPRRQLALHR